MNDREAIKNAIETLRYYAPMASTAYNDCYASDKLYNAADDLEEILRERVERAQGCRYCSLGADLKNDEEMEMTLFNYAEGTDFDVYPFFCPMCGRPLKE